MRIYCKNDAGEVVYIADCSLPNSACLELDSGKSFYYELQPVISPALPLGDSGTDIKSGSITIERILLEPYRLYRNQILVDMGAMIADPRHVAMLAENIKQRTAARDEINAITTAWRE